MAKQTPKDRLMESETAQKPDIIDKLGDWMEKNHADPGSKIGAGHLAAMMRLGLKELARVITPDQPIEEPGLVGNPTNIEVLRGKEQTAPSGYPVVETAEIGPPQATPSIKAEATPQLQRDPLDMAREQSREVSQDKSQQREIEV